MKNYIKYFGILALGMTACEPEFDTPVDEPGTYSSGEADFSHYVALGNSLTAGYADNALYITGQENSYPNILAQQFATVGGGEFTQPLMADNAGGLLLGGKKLHDTRLVLYTGEDGTQAPMNYRGAEPSTEVTDKLSGPYNNMGVPGAKVAHLLAPNYGDVTGLAAQPATANPYFVRFASSPETSVVADAVAQDPTFFSLWIGNNDVLGYATSGGVNDEDITDPAVFQGAYAMIVNSLVETGAEGVLINIPNVTDVPYFTTVPYAPLDPTNPDFGPMIPTLNATFAQLNPALLALRGVGEETPGESEFSIEFNPEGASALVIRDESLADISQQLTEVLVANGMDRSMATIYGMQYGQVRQATAEDLVRLNSSSVLGTVNQDRVEELMALGVPQEMAGQLAVNGVTYPLEDQHVLTPSEQELIAEATASYNASIKNIAEANGLAFLDAAEFLSELSNGGIKFDAGVMTSEFGSGGVFSLDGIHLTPRGNALVAERLIEVINNTYNADVPTVNVGSYGTVTPSNQVN